MAEEVSRTIKKHSLILENRNELSVSGVDEVLGFNDETVTLVTQLGRLIVSGDKLHISHFSQETGELHLDGRIDSLRYTEDKKPQGSLISRLFR